MPNTSDYLLKLADICDSKGYIHIANDVDNLIKNRSFIKVSQYVGVVGTCLTNSRGIQQCVKNKRVSSDAPMQELVMECLSEYQDGNKHNSDWIGKYASVNERNYIRAFLKQACSNGIDINTATRKLIETVAINNDIDKDIQQLKDVWAKIEAAGLNKNAEFKEFEQLIKQAGVWDTIKNVGKGVANVGKGVANWGFYKARYEEVIKNLTRNVQELFKVSKPVYDNVNRLIAHLGAMPAVKPQIDALRDSLAKNDFNSLKQNIVALRQTLLAPKTTIPQEVSNSATIPPAAGQDYSNTQLQLQEPTQELKLAPASKWNYQFKSAQAQNTGKLNVQGIVQFINSIQNQMNEIQKTVQLMYDNMKTLSQAKALLNVAPQEVAALNKNLAQVSQNPLNVDTVTQLNTTIGNLDAKLRQSAFNKTEEAGTPPDLGVAPVAGPPSTTVPTAAPAGSAGVVDPKVDQTKTFIKTLNDMTQTYPTLGPLIKQLQDQLNSVMQTQQT